jgi:hypothetical protein
MNWTPEAVRAEMDYRVERALRDAQANDVRGYPHSVRHGPVTWWRRLRTQHHTTQSEDRNAA